MNKLITSVGIIWLWSLAISMPFLSIFIFTHLEVLSTPDSNPIWLGVFTSIISIWVWYMLIMDIKEQNKK